MRSLRRPPFASSRGIVVAVGLAALTLSACGTEGDTAGVGEDTDTASPPTETPQGDEATEDEAGTTLAIGYISGGDSDPFVFRATESIRRVTEELGVGLEACDADFTAEGALECARTLSAFSLDSMINWQFVPDAAEAVCEAYGNLPTVAMDTPEEPCQEVFVGANNRQAGLLAGEFLGEYAQTEFDCEYDLFVSIELPSLPEVNEDRAGGTRAGFEEVCGAIPSGKFEAIDKAQGGSDHQENVRSTFTDILTANPDAEVVLVSSPFGDPDGQAAWAAASTAGREEGVWIVSQGADETGQAEVRENRHYLASVGYFPECYGDLAVPAAIRLARGEDVPSELLIDHVVITAENIDEYYPDEAGSDVTCQSEGVLEARQQLLQDDSS